MAEDRCVLCLNKKRSPKRVLCGHSFCKECLDEFKTYHHQYAWASRCPICRCRLNEKRPSVNPSITNFDTINNNHNNNNNNDTNNNTSNSNNNLATTTTTEIPAADLSSSPTMSPSYSPDHEFFSVTIDASVEDPDETDDAAESTEDEDVFYYDDEDSTDFDEDFYELMDYENVEDEVEYDSDIASIIFNSLAEENESQNSADEDTF